MQAPDWALSLNGLRSLRHAGQAWPAPSFTDDGIVADNESTAVSNAAVDRRRHRNLETRPLASLEGLIAGIELGFKEHDRLLLARQMLATPLVSACLIAKELDVTQRAALRLVEELNLREMAGRGRFHAWGIV